MKNGDLITIAVPHRYAERFRWAARKYRTTEAGMLGIIIAYYFGDGRNHLQCEGCDWWEDGCKYPALGEQTTIPVLDEGMVVVGLSSADRGF